MVTTADEIQRIVRDFLHKLEAAGNLKVERAILFGSYVRGWPHRWSDIDLVVLSKGFQGMSHRRRVDLLARVTWGSDHRLEPLALTPGEYRHAGPATFLGEVKRAGRVVYPVPER